MMTNMFKELFQSFSRTGSDRTSSLRSCRTNRRYPIGLGIEGLEGRVALSGGIAPVTVTVTNQADTSTPTPNSPDDSTDAADPTIIELNSTDQETLF
jgi:hypothetical protein